MPTLKALTGAEAWGDLNHRLLQLMKKDLWQAWIRNHACRRAPPWQPMVQAHHRSSLEQQWLASHKQIIILLYWHGRLPICDFTGFPELWTSTGCTCFAEGRLKLKSLLAYSNLPSQLINSRKKMKNLRFPELSLQCRPSVSVMCVFLKILGTKREGDGWRTLKRKEFDEFSYTFVHSLFQVFLSLTWGQIPLQSHSFIPSFIHLWLKLDISWDVQW